METLKNKEANKKILGYVILLVWVISTLAMFLLLIAIPHEHVVITPLNFCESYAVARGGWGCAKLGDAFANPVLFWLTTFISNISAYICMNFGFNRLRNAYVVILFNTVLLAAMVSIVRCVYFVQGYVTAEYFLAAIVALSVLISLLLLRYFKLRKTNDD